MLTLLEGVCHVLLSLDTGHYRYHHIPLLLVRCTLTANSMSDEWGGRPVSPCVEKKTKVLPCTGFVQAVRPIRGVEVYLYSFLTTALEGDEGSALRPGRSLPPGKSRYPLYRRLGGPQGRPGQLRKISPPPGFDPRTFLLLAQSLYRLN
jgi:hypothetical protein